MQVSICSAWVTSQLPVSELNKLSSLSFKSWLVFQSLEILVTLFWTLVPSLSSLFPYLFWRCGQQHTNSYKQSNQRYMYPSVLPLAALPTDAMGRLKTVKTRCCFLFCYLLQHPGALLLIELHTYALNANWDHFPFSAWQSWLCESRGRLSIFLATAVPQKLTLTCCLWKCWSPPWSRSFPRQLMGSSKQNLPSVGDSAHDPSS